MTDAEKVAACEAVLESYRGPAEFPFSYAEDAPEDFWRMIRDLAQALEIDLYRKDFE